MPTAAKTFAEIPATIRNYWKVNTGSCPHITRVYYTLRSAKEYVLEG
jgi:hypothetical protein